MGELHEDLKLQIAGLTSRVRSLERQMIALIKQIERDGVYIQKHEFQLGEADDHK